MNNYGLIIGLTSKHWFYIRLLTGKGFWVWSLRKFWRLTYEVMPKQYPIVFNRADIRKAVKRWD